MISVFTAVSYMVYNVLWYQVMNVGALRTGCSASYILYTASIFQYAIIMKIKNFQVSEGFRPPLWGPISILYKDNEIIIFYYRVHKGLVRVVKPVS